MMPRYRTKNDRCKLLIQRTIVDHRERGARLRYTAEVEDHLRHGRLLLRPDAPIADTPVDDATDAHSTKPKTKRSRTTRAKQNRGDQ